MKLTIDHELAALIPPLRPEERAGLEASLLAEGCRDPIVTWGGTILDGHHRYAICTEHGIEFAVVERDFNDRGDARIWCLRNQGGRRNLTDDQRAMLAIVLQEALSEQAVREQRRGARAAVVVRNPMRREDPDGPHDACAPSEPPAPKRDTRAEAGAALGVSRGRVQQAKALAKARPDLAEQVARGDLSIREARRDERAAASLARAKVAAEAGAAPPGIDLRCVDVADLLDEVCGASLVHADPPWAYDNQRIHGATDGHYIDVAGMDPIVSVVDAAFDCAAEDAYLLLWCTLPMLADWFAASTGMRWTYKSGGVWAKTGRLGSGFHWRGDGEVLLLYVRGSPRPFERSASNAHVSERTEHSEKPEAWLRSLVRAFAPADGLVFDLYAGLAPMARACAHEGRSYIGAEMAVERHEMARALLVGAG